MSKAIFRILSGVHEGAEIELEEGAWVFGRDDSCDIILSDRGVLARHGALTVDAHGVVHFEALDGNLENVEEGKEESGATLLAGHPYSLGGVIFTWGAPEAGEEFWKGVDERLHNALRRDAAPAPQAATAASAGEPEANEASDEAAPEAPAEEEKSESEAQESTEASVGPKVGRLAVAAVVVLVVLLLAGAASLKSDAMRERVHGLWASIAAWHSGEREAAQAAARLAALQSRLKAANFADVKVAATPTGGFHFTGSVVDDVARGRLIELARSLNAPAVLDVAVQSDKTRPLQAAFASLGFKTDVTLEGARPKVSGYMLSPVVEERAFMAARAMTPTVTDAAPLRHIVHRQDVEPMLNAALAERGLRGVEVLYGRGDVSLKAVLTPEVQARLEDVVADVKRRAGVPLQVAVVNAEGGKAAVVERTSAPAAGKKSGAAKFGFAVKGVSAGDVPFVTLTDGSTVFAGGLLPGGWELRGIGTQRLVLVKDGKKVIYPLEFK